MKHVLTAKVGNNADLFPDILRLYVPPGSKIADVTFGRGIFWQRVPPREYRIFLSDLAMTADETGWPRQVFVYGSRANLRQLPYADQSLDGLVLDPPYLYVGGFRSLSSYWDPRRPAPRGGSHSYGNKERAVAGIYGVEAVDRLYYEGMAQAARVLKRRGVLIVKCMDQVMSGKQVWAHVTYLRYGDQLGFENLDLFVVVRKSRPLMRHKPEQQKHARRNHSYFLVMRKRR